MGDVTKYRVLVGSILMTLPNAIPWYFGNVLTYAFSYFRCELHNENAYDEIVWLMPIFLILVVLGMVTVDFTLRWVSLRVLLVTVIAIYDLGTFLTFFSVQHSIGMTVFTFSICAGYAHGVMLSLCYTFVKTLFDKDVGFATALVASSCGFGAVACTAVTTAFLNRDNLKPEGREDSVFFFSDRSINRLFPYLFLILGMYSLFFHIVAFLFLKVLFSNGNTEEENIEKTPVLKVTNNSITEKSPMAVSNVLHCPQDNAKGHPPFTGVDLFDEKSLDPAKTVISHSKSEVNEMSSAPVLCPLEVDSSRDQTPMSVLRSEQFYHLLFSMTSMSIGFVTVTSCYKLYGQLWIHDDDFLSLVGSVSDVTTVFCRISCGLLMDRLGVFNVILALLVLNAVGMAAMYFLALSRWVYLLCVALVVGLQSATYSVYPVAVLKCFGGKYYATNTGLIMTSMVTASLVVPPLMSAFIRRVGWFWFFLFDSAISLVATLGFIARVHRKHRLQALQ